uniref:Coiled-coil domain containing 148 n=1 Tax=Mastacembelus armatus TaxID=205130 RepID=A0A7N8XWX1_9TELE
DRPLQKYLNSTSDNLVDIDNIPEEVVDSDCPYPELKDSLIQTFQSLSESYQNRLQSLQEQLQRIERFCGWCPDDHQCFQFILTLYTHDIPNHRALCLDMLQRLFPGKTRQELIEHGRVLDWQCFTQTQLNVVIHQWQRDYEELLSRALVTLQEARFTHQEELELQRDRQQQQDICSHLRNKVSLQQWRAQQEEVARLEAAIAARQQEEEEARLKKEQEKEAAIKAQQKEKVILSSSHALEREAAHVLYECLEKGLFRSDVHTLCAPPRVQFRSDMLQRRREEREAQELERQRKEEEKQNRLEALRNQVRVVAEADPERIMADTHAWKSRQLNAMEFDLQRPLYSINTYTDTQIVSDPRVRVEQALREAGLHHSQYAKEVLSVITPPKLPRRDTKSILKF